MFNSFVLNPSATASTRAARGVFWMVVVCVSCGFATTGAVVGFFMGLAAYPPTAWFAIFELGIPAAVAGFVLAVPVAAITAVIRRGSDLRFSHPRWEPAPE